jgi:glycosyltransferase involved in cell wall biosynthesis
MSARVSLLIPAYNGADDLPTLLQDAANQTVAFHEVWVYDDASEDNTSAVAREWGAQVIRGEANRGAAVARNALVTASESEWIHFHDADDRLAPQFNERMLRENPDFRTCILCAATEVDARTGQQISLLEWSGLNDCADPVRFFLATHCAMVVGLYPRDAVCQTGFREDLRGGEDYDFHVRLAQAGLGFRAIPDALATVRRRTGKSFTDRESLVYLRDLLHVLADYAAALPEKYFAELGFVLMDVAWRLYAAGDKLASRKAIETAQRVGRKEISSDSSALRVVSKYLGAEAAFRVRALKNSVGRPRKGNL